MEGWFPRFLRRGGRELGLPAGIPSGAKAHDIIYVVCGTTEVVPFQIIRIAYLQG
jgi:hypothetical protein